MTHTATKIAAGSYEYRGYTIRKSMATWGATMWFMDKDWDTAGPSNLDPERTLLAAKRSIDIALH